MVKTGFFTRMNEVGGITLPEGLYPKNNENRDLILKPYDGKEG